MPPLNNKTMVREHWIQRLPDGSAKYTFNYTTLPGSDDSDDFSL